MTSPFNPAQFAKKSESDKDVPQKAAAPYETTGNASRDGVRKILFEILSSDGDKAQAAVLAAEIESELCKVSGDDARSRPYRDKGRQMQLKLKGPRFADNRAKVLAGELTPEQLCSDEWLSAKASGPAGPSGGAVRGRGMPGMMARGRGAPLPGRGMRGGPSRGMMPGRMAPAMPRAPAIPSAAQPQDKSDPNPAEKEEEPESVEESKQQSNDTQHAKPEPVSVESNNAPESVDKPEPNEAVEPPTQVAADSNKDEIDDKPVGDNAQPASNVPAADEEPEKPEVQQPPRPKFPAPRVGGMPSARGPQMTRGAPRVPGRPPVRGTQPPKRPTVQSAFGAPAQPQSEKTKEEPAADISEPAKPPPEEEKSAPFGAKPASALAEQPEQSKVPSDDVGQVPSAFGELKKAADEAETSKVVMAFDDSVVEEKPPATAEPGSGLLQPAPKVEVSLDDSMMSGRGSAQGDRPRKKKKKVVKKIIKRKKVANEPPGVDVEITKENAPKEEVSSADDKKAPEVKPAEPVEVQEPVSVPLPPQPQQIPEQPAPQVNVPEPAPVKVEEKPKPKELSPEEMQQIKAERHKASAHKRMQSDAGMLSDRANRLPLTTENLQNKFGGRQVADDLDTESIIFLDNAIIAAQENAANGASSPNVRVPPIAINANGGSHPKSSSLANEAEYARLQDQLAGKKSTILDLQEKLQLAQSDLKLLERKYTLVSEENFKLKGRGSERLEVLRLTQELQGARTTHEEVCSKHEAEKAALREELEATRRDRDTHRDRCQKVFRDAQAWRDRLERQMQSLIEQQTGNNAAHEQGRSFGRFPQPPSDFDQGKPPEEVEFIVPRPAANISHNPNNQQDLQTQLIEMRVKYEQQLNSQKRQLDQALGQLEHQRSDGMARQRRPAEVSPDDGGVLGRENGGRVHQMSEEDKDEEDFDEGQVPQIRETGTDLGNAVQILQQVPAGSGGGTTEFLMNNQYSDGNLTEEVADRRINSNIAGQELVEVQQAAEPPAPAQNQAMPGSSLLDEYSRPQVFFENDEGTGQEAYLSQQQQQQLQVQQAQQEEAAAATAFIEPGLLSEGGQLDCSGIQESGQNAKDQHSKGQQREQQEGGRGKKPLPNDDMSGEEGPDDLSDEEDEDSGGDEDIESDGSYRESEGEDASDDGDESHDSGRPGDLGSNADEQLTGRGQMSQSARADMGGLGENQFPAATIPSQSTMQGSNSQSRQNHISSNSQRQTGNQGRQASNQFGSNMNPGSQQQYGTGSSGASGHHGSSVRGMMQGGSQNLQSHDEAQMAAGNQNSQAPAAGGQGRGLHGEVGFSQGTTGSGGGGPATIGNRNSQNQRRSRRGNRQQNQQPSSGANERTDARPIASGSVRTDAQGSTRTAQNGTATMLRQGQGRQDFARSNNAQNVPIIPSQARGQQPEESTEFAAAAQSTNPSGQQTTAVFGGQSPFETPPPQSSQDQSSNLESRSRPQRTQFRGRQARNNQQTSGTSQGGVSAQQAASQNQQMRPEPVSLSQERQQEAAQRDLRTNFPGRTQIRAAGSGTSEGQDNSSAAQQVIQMNVPASSPSNQYPGSRGSNVQSSAIQGAAQQTSSSQMIPASTASHSGGQNSQSATQRGLVYPNNSSGPSQPQVAANSVPHGGGGRLPQQQPSQSSQPHTTAAVMHHAVNFDSGSTGFAGTMPQASATGEQSYQHPAQQRPGSNRVGSSGSAGGVPYTQLSSVSSPPSNNLGLAQNPAFPQARNQPENSQSQNQQNDTSQATGNIGSNAPDMSGPGAVGAPPSSSQTMQQIPAAQNARYPSSLGQTNVSIPTMGLPTSSGATNNTGSSGNQGGVSSAGTQQPNNQRRTDESRVSGGMSAMQSASENLHGQMAVNQGLGGSQQYPFPMRQSPMAVPQNSSNQQRNNSAATTVAANQSSQAVMEEEKQSSSSQNQQQSLMTIPSSVFGGGGRDNPAEMNHQSNQYGFFDNPFSGQQQTPAALKAQQRSVGQGSSGAHLGRPMAQQQVHKPSIAMEYGGGAGVQGERGTILNRNMMGGRPVNQMNSDSRVTSGANTPNKDGASTPTTHQQQQYQNTQMIQGRVQMMNQNNGVVGHQMINEQSAVEFNSAVTSGLNNYLQKTNMGQGMMGGEDENRQITNAASSFDPPNIIDQISAQARAPEQTSMTTASLFDDLGDFSQPTLPVTSRAQVGNPFQNAGGQTSAQQETPPNSSRQVMEEIQQPVLPAAASSGGGMTGQTSQQPPPSEDRGLIPNNMFD